MRLAYSRIYHDRGANGSKRVEGQIKESEEKVGKKRNEVSTLPTPQQYLEELANKQVVTLQQEMQALQTPSQA